MGQLIMVYTCTACKQVMKVPWYPEGAATPPEIVKGIICRHRVSLYEDEN